MAPEPPIICSQKDREEIQSIMPEGPGIYKSAAPTATLFSYAADKWENWEN